jgi:hypothetical protein
MKIEFKGGFSPKGFILVGSFLVFIILSYIAFRISKFGGDVNLAWETNPDCYREATLHGWMRK